MTASPLTISFPSSEEHYKCLLGGPPETQSLRSGYVVLAPGEAVGEHTTGEGEEMLIPLAGCGELRFPGQEPMKVAPGRVLYNPPQTVHDVVNTGCEPLVYIYVVAGRHEH